VTPSGAQGIRTLPSFSLEGKTCVGKTISFPMLLSVFFPSKTSSLGFALSGARHDVLATPKHMNLHR